MNRKLIVAAIAVTTLAVGGTAAALTSPGLVKDSAGRPDAPASGSLSDTDDGNGRNHDGRHGNGRHDDGRNHDGRNDDGRNDDGDARKLAEAEVSAQDALEKATSAVPGTVKSIGLDDDNSGLVWDADIFGEDQKWHDVTIDAATGKVLTSQASQSDADDDGDNRNDQDDQSDQEDQEDQEDDGSDD